MKNLKTVLKNFLLDLDKLENSTLSTLEKVDIFLENAISSLKEHVERVLSTL